MNKNMKDLDIDNMNEDLEPTDYELEKIEQENNHDLEDWNLLECFACGRKVTSKYAVVIDDVIYCRECA